MVSRSDSFLREAGECDRFRVRLSRNRNAEIKLPPRLYDLCCNMLRVQLLVIYRCLFLGLARLCFYCQPSSTSLEEWPYRVG